MTPTVYLIAIIHLFTPHSTMNACSPLVLCWALRMQRWMEDFIRIVSQWAAISNFSSSLSSLVLANCRLLLPMTHFQVTVEWVSDDRWFRDHAIHWLDSLLQDDCHALWMTVRAMGLGLRDNYSFSLIQFVENELMLSPREDSAVSYLRPSWYFLFQHHTIFSYFLHHNYL